MAELVTIAEFQNVNDAYLLKARLESNGIETFMQNENMNTLLATGSVKVQVRLDDAHKAMDILYED